MANVIGVKGGKVHSDTEGDHDAFPFCRTGSQTNSGTKYRSTDAPLSCKTCLTYEARRAARAKKINAAHADAIAENDTRDMLANVPLENGYMPVYHVRTGRLVGWLRPGAFRPVEAGMPTA